MASITQAFVLAAGLGTRLRPLTENVPKPLVPIFQKPLITFALDHLIDAGVTSFVINTHRLPETFARAFPTNQYCDHPIKLVNEPVLLETGGGIKNVESLLDDSPFITYSGDILTDTPLQPLINEHFRRGNDVTLGLRTTKLGSAIAVRNTRVVDIAKRYGIAGDYDFANIAIWNRTIFDRIPPNQKISFIPVLTEWIANGGKIGGIVLKEGHWFNLGSRNEYLDVHRAILAGWRPSYVKDAEWPISIHATAKIDSTAKLLGCSVVGAHSVVGPDASLEDTIVWSGAQIASGSELIRCIVRSNKHATGIHRDSDI